MASRKPTTLEHKRVLFQQLQQELQRALDVMTAAAHAAKDAATHEEMKPENDKDTRGIEAGYLAAGQAKRAGDIRRTLQELAVLEVRTFGRADAIGPTALVALDDSGVERRVVVSPHGGGLKIQTADGEVQVVTPLSPLGTALIGKHAGDVIELRSGGRVREMEILDVC